MNLHATAATCCVPCDGKRTEFTRGHAKLSITVLMCMCSLQPFVPVKEQMEPDPEFPTVRFPNPEEGKSALDLSFKTADGHNSTIILANDPDADRLAVAEKQPRCRKYCTSL